MIMSNDKYIKVLNPVLFPQVKELKSTIKVLDTPTNLAWLLKDNFKAEIRFNMMSRRRELSLPNEYFFEDDKENSFIGLVQEIAQLNGMPWRNVNEHLGYLANLDPYHPIMDILTANAWDGKKRLDSFLRTIKSTNPETDQQIIKTWMISAIAAIYSPKGFNSHGVLVLQGEQGIGKTAWV